jgi:hypothetical protein
MSGVRFHPWQVRALTASLLALPGLAGCGAGDHLSGVAALRCPAPQGEFGPTDCAIVAGVARDGSGQLLGLPSIRADSTIPRVAYLYASNTVHPGIDGTFEIIVVRSTRLTPPAAPDTATVELKAYSDANPSAGDRPAAAAAILMQFAPLGSIVRRSEATAPFLPR